MLANQVGDAGKTGVTSPARNGAVVLGAALGLAGGYSAAYFGTLSVFLKPIAAAFGWSRAEASLVAVLAQVGISAGAPIVGLLIDRQGARHVIAVSALLFALGMFVLPASPNSLVIFGALTFLIGFVAVGTAPVGYLSVLPRVFDRRLGLAFGVSMLGLGLGTVLFPINAQGWITAYGWQTAYRLVAAVILVAGLIAVALLTWGAGPAVTTGIARDERRAGPVPGDTPLEAMRSWRFWLIAVVFLTVATFGLGAVIHMAPLLSDRGIPVEIAARGAALIGVGVMVGRFATGALLDIFHARIVAMFAFVLGAAGLAIFASSPQASFPVVAAGTTLIGFAIGAEGDFIPFFVRRYFGLNSLGVLYGVLLCIYSLGGVAGPVLYGFAFDRLGSYTVPLEIGSVACACCAGGARRRAVPVCG